MPAGKLIHAIVDNHATYKHPKVRQRLDRRQRFTIHFAPTSCSWLNAVEGFLAKLSKRRLKRGVFRSVADLQVSINRFVEDANMARLDQIRATYDSSGRFHPWMGRR